MYTESLAQTFRSRRSTLRCWGSLRSVLRRIYREERGEIAPITYLAGLLPALMMMFFAIDAGLRLGKRLAVESAAMCAASAAATQLPRGDAAGASVNDEKLALIRRAAAACLAGIVNRDKIGPLDNPAALEMAVLRAESLTEVSVWDLQRAPRTYFGHNEVVEIEVAYRNDLVIPFSPFNWFMEFRQPMRARARAMLQTIK